jgi:hypothetical protein
MLPCLIPPAVDKSVENADAIHSPVNNTMGKSGYYPEPSFF